MGKLPNCFDCGADLSKAGRMVLDLPHIPGKPRLAWCLDHAPTWWAQPAEMTEEALATYLMQRVHHPDRMIIGRAYRKRMEESSRGPVRDARMFPSR